MPAWKFKPRLIPTIAVVILLPALMSLGFWQLDRAEQKMASYSQYLNKQRMEPVVLNDLAPDIINMDELDWRHVLVHGSYADRRHYLLDNQVLNGRAGYFVYTPFRLYPGETYVLVNRGWLPAGTDRGRAPTIRTQSDLISLNGIIKKAPKTGILLSDEIYELLTQDVVRVQKIDLLDIGRRSGWKFLPFILRLNSTSESGFVRNWREPGSDRNKHLGYAFQWFGLSALLVIIYIFVNMKRTMGDND